LVELSLSEFKDDVNCVTVSNGRTSESKSICAFSNSQETQSDIINGWIKAIKLFKFDCLQPLIAKKDGEE